MWLRAAQISATAKHAHRSLFTFHTRPRPSFFFDARRFLQTNRLLAISQDVNAEHEDATLAAALPSALMQPHIRNTLTAGGSDWLSILDAPDVKTVLRRAQEAGYSRMGTPEQPLVGTATYPTWLPLYLLYHQASTPQDVLSTVELIYRQLCSFDPAISEALIVLTVARLAERKFTASLRALVWRFCNSSVPSERHFNLLLRALSLHPRSEETSLLAARILTTMSQHGFKVVESTYDAMLHRHFVTLKVAAAVRRKMKHDRVAPTELHLKSFLNLMVAHRFSRPAARYLDAIHRMRQESKAKIIPYGSKPSFLDGVRRTVLNTRFLRSIRRPWAALRYIEQLTAAQSEAPIRTFMFRKGKPRTLQRVWRRKRVQIHVKDWISALYVASRSKSITAHDFLTGYRQAAGAYPPNRQAYSTVVRGLLYKRDYANAAALWDESCSLGLPLDTVSVGIGAHALAMNGDFQRAFQLLEKVHAGHQIWVAEGKGRGRRNSRHLDRRPPAEVNHYAVHQLMVALRRMGRPDVVFALWDDMKTLYGLSPDAYSLNIILQTARWARKYDDTIRGQLSHLGFGPSVHSSTIQPSDPRIEAASRISTMLEPTKRPWITGQWKAKPAGQVALQIVVEMFLGNWPDLRGVLPPVGALRRSGRDIAISPVSEAINSVTGRSLSEQSALLSLSVDPATTLYPHIVPTDVSLRAIIDLLAAESLHAEIPLILAWMRALDIVPSKTTIATALIHWVDVSMDSPFVERIKGRRRRDPYTMLMQWLDDWVGSKNMPGRQEMSAEMQRSAYYKDVQYLDVIKERVHVAESRRAANSRSSGYESSGSRS